MKKITFKITQQLFETICNDLCRRHSFAEERVGFVACRFGLSPRGDLLILAYSFLQVTDDSYVDDHRFGALLGPKGFSTAFGFAYRNEVGMFHVHLHHHQGQPGFSGTDNHEMSKYVPDFFNVRPQHPHGALVFSFNSITGKCWISQNSGGISVSDFYIVGAPVKQSKGKA
jgi:hypothetical protein